MGKRGNVLGARREVARGQVEVSKGTPKQMGWEGKRLGGFEKRMPVGNPEGGQGKSTHAGGSKVAGKKQKSRGVGKSKKGSKKKKEEFLTAGRPKASGGNQWVSDTSRKKTMI